MSAQREQLAELEPNPKLASQGQDNQEKDPADWVSGDDPITGAQKSYLKTLSEQADHPEAFDERVSKAEASRRIDALKSEIGR